MTHQVEPLKKLQLQVISTNNLETKPVTFSHIFGLVPEGLSPFEAELDGKKQGDSILLSVPATGFHEFFGNCTAFLNDLRGVPVVPKVIELKVEVIAIENADNREIIKSLAKATSHGGCGGSCGCGCS